MRKNVNPNHGISNSVFNEFDNNDDIIFINKSNVVKTFSSNNILITDPLRNKRLLMLPIISIVFLVTLVSSMSYAYYALKTNTVNASNVNIAMPSRVACNFNVTNNTFTTTVTAAQFGQSNIGSTIFSNTISSNITLNGLAGCQCNYGVYLYENGGDHYVHTPDYSDNEFIYQTSATANSASSPNSASVSTSSSNNLDWCQDGTIAGGCRIGQGTIAVTTANTKVTHTYSLTTALYNNNYNQYSLTNKTYKYRVGVEVMNCNFLNLTDYLRKDSRYSNTVLGSSYSRTSIEEIYINDTKTVPSGVVSSWDVSEKQNGSIMAYLMNGSASGKYKLYIGQEGGVRANPDSSYLFYNYSNVQNADLTNLITDDVRDMTKMFIYFGQSATSFSLTGLSSWNTSKVTKMYEMFLNSGMMTDNFSIDLSSWNVSNVTNMSEMFFQAGSNATTWSIGNLNNWNVSKVMDMSSMFARTGGQATTYNIGNLSSWNVSNVTNMSRMFESAASSATTFSLNLSSWNVSKVIDMSWMFYQVGGSATTWSIGDLSNWNTSNVISMRYMFASAGRMSGTWSIGNVSGWNVSKVTDMSNMFGFAGDRATSFSLTLTNWNVSNVTDMSGMFSTAGNRSSTFELIGLSTWNVSNVTDMSRMFSSAGCNATTWSVGDISGWNTSKVTDMSSMFAYAGQKTAIWSIDISNWDVSKVTNMSRMFYQTASQSQYFAIDLSNWNTSNVTDMSSMFDMAGCNASNWSIGSITNWDVSNVTTMSRMFYLINGGQKTGLNMGVFDKWDTSKVTNMNQMFASAFINKNEIAFLGTLHIYATDVTSMFDYDQYMSIRLKIHTNPTSYSGMFYGAVTVSGASITVDYTSAVTNIDNMIATKSSTSNVIKGNLIS